MFRFYFIFAFLLSVGGYIDAAASSRNFLSLLPHGGAAVKTQSNLTAYNNTEVISTSTQVFRSDDDNNNRQSPRPLRVLFLSADTGGGHRASAEALAKQFLLHFPGSTYDLLDIWTLDGVYPYKTLVPSYKHLSAHPHQWRLFYHLSNTIPNCFFANLHSNFMCEKKIRKRIASYDPDVIVSVHPAMNNAPRKAVRRLSERFGKHIPFFTVVTDLGSGHSMWFQRNVDKLYVASERLRKIAKRRGRCKDDKIVMVGLPIRHDFAVQAERMGDRTLPAGKEYQANMKNELGMDNSKPMVLVMGGGEGVGSLSHIVDQLYIKFRNQGVDATICVVCGRNEKLKNDLAQRDWDHVVKTGGEKPKKSRVSTFLHRLLKSKTAKTSVDNDTSSNKQGNVDVVGLGYVNQMAEYMVAADVLVSKAGPGTIAEAAAVGLPVMLTSYLPGQEAGNVEVVIDAGFGDYCREPTEIASTVSGWLQDPDRLTKMSHASKQIGSPYAAEDIVKDIGSITQGWIDVNLKGNNGERKSILPAAME